MSNSTELPPQIFVDLSSAVRNAADAIFFVSTFVYLRVMLKKKVFHMNLYTILILSPLSFTVILLPNIVKDVIQWFTRLSNKQMLDINMVVDMGQFSSGYNLLVLVSERSIATVYVASYENMCATTPWFAVFLVAIQWVASVILLYVNYNSGLSESQDLVYSIALAISILIACILSATVFTLLPSISKRAHKRQLGSSISSISRYQAVENIRSAKVLSRLVLATVASVVLMLGVYSYIRFVVELHLRASIYNLHFTVVASCATFLNILVLWSHDTLRKELVRFTHTGWFFASKVREPAVRSVSGSRLDVPTALQTSTYFQAYEDIWNK